MNITTKLEHYHLAVPEDELVELKALATLVGGRVGYRDPDYGAEFPPSLVR